MYVNADMDEDMVPVMLFLRLVLWESDVKLMPQFSRKLGWKSSHFHHGGVVALWSCTAQKLLGESRQGELQAWAVTLVLQ